jgi:CheY-like chemotaxis protein
MILIVEDFADTARALCGLITHKGYPCHWVSNGQEAIAYIRQHPQEQPLLVVLDEMMPGMSGTEVLRALRADPKTASISVMIYTAGYDVAKRDESVALGVVAYLLKGTDIEGTLKTISEWYERIGGVRAAHTLERKPDPKL